jgi:cation transport ATPase
MTIDTQARSASPPSSRVGVSWSPRTLQLHDDEVFGPGGTELCGRFLRRVFTVPEVQSVEIDRPRSTAQIRYERGRTGMADLLHRLAKALRSSSEGSSAAETASLLPSDLSQPRLTIYRHRGLLTTWRVLADQPGLLTLRHDLLSLEPALARRIASQVEAVHGVQSSLIRPLTGTLRIRFDPAQTRVERLLRALETAPDSLSRVVAEAGDPAPVKFGLVNAAVALSVISDFFVPPVWPATAALLVGSNVGMFRDALDQLGKRQLGMPVLFVTIAASTLASGQFLPWAVMNWMLKLWKRQYQEELATARRRLLGDVIQEQRFARLEAAGGIEIEVPVDRLTPGDLILVSSGEKLPVDGRIVRGHGLLDERVVRGTSGMTRKSPEESILAGSIVISGDFQVETQRYGPGTRAASLSRIALAAVNHETAAKTPTVKGERFASRLVAPTLATAGLGYSLGGFPMALAILDTDFASGPGMAYPLESLQALSLCFQQGIVVRDPEALDRLAHVDVLLLDQHPGLEATDPEVAGVRVFPGHTEFQVLQYAATAMRDLDDERTLALRAECRSRRIALLDRVPIDYGTDVMLIHHGQVIKVGNLGGQGPVPDHGPGAYGQPPARSIDSLMVGINGQIAGLVGFRPSARPRAATAIQELRIRARHPLAIGLVSESADSLLHDSARALGVDFHQGSLSTSNLVQLIRGCHRRGLKIAFAGDCLLRGRAAREADVAVSLDADGLEKLDRNPASIILLQPDLRSLCVLSEVTRVHRRRVLTAQGSALLPNLFCMAGAFFLGFSSLVTVIITNLGTYSTYARTTAGIRGLERQFARTCGRLSKNAG